MNQMGLSPSAVCECGTISQTARHMTSKWPYHQCNGNVGVATAARNWFRDMQFNCKGNDLDIAVLSYKW